MKLVMYPFIIIFSWLVVCIRDTTLAYNITFKHINSVAMLGNALAVSQGFVTTVYFFATNEEVLSSWAQLCRGVPLAIISSKSRRDTLKRVHLALASDDNEEEQMKGRDNLDLEKRGDAELETTSITAVTVTRTTFDAGSVSAN